MWAEWLSEVGTVQGDRGASLDPGDPKRKQHMRIAYIPGGSNKAKQYVFGGCPVTSQGHRFRGSLFFGPGTAPPGVSWANWILRVLQSWGEEEKSKTI